MSLTVPIGDVAIIQRGSIDPRKHSDTLFELYSIAGFDDNKTPEQLVGSDIRSSKTVLPTQGVLFSKLNPRINRVWTFRGNGPANRIASTEFVCLVPDEQRLQLEYLGWRLRVPHIVDELPMGTAAATKSRERIQPKSLLQLPISLPPLHEQQRIVSILNQGATIERLRARARELMGEFIPALFITMFGDPVENPMQWAVATLGDTSEVQSGLQVTKKRHGLPIEKPYLRVANVLRNRLDLNEVKNMRVTKREFERVRLARGDLLVVEGHGNASEIGRAALWDGSISDCVHQNHLIRVRLDHSMMLPEFACAYLNSPLGRQHLIRSGKTTSGLNTITTSNVKSLPVPVPPLSLQGQYVEIVEASRATLSVAVSGFGISLQLNNSLMNRLLAINE